MNVLMVCSVRFRCSRCRYGCRTELTKVSGTGIDVVPNLPNEVSGTGIDVPKLPKCPVPIRTSVPYRRYPYPYRTERTKVSGTGIDVVPNLPKCLVQVLMSY